MNDDLKFKKRYIITIICLFILIIVLLSIKGILSTNPIYNKSEIGTTTTISNSEDLSNHLNNNIPYLKYIGIYYSIVFPEIETLNVDSVKTENNIITSNLNSKYTKHKLIIDTNTNSITIKDKHDNIIYSTTAKKESTKLSPHILTQIYLPRKSLTISSGKTFDLYSKDEKLLIISFNYCPDSQSKQDAIEVTKKWISDLDSDSSFFSYQTTDLCF